MKVNKEKTYWNKRRGARSERSEGDESDMCNDDKTLRKDAKSCLEERRRLLK